LASPLLSMDRFMMPFSRCCVPNVDA
jgi:hypothetical protein